MYTRNDSPYGSCDNYRALLIDSRSVLNCYRALLVDYRALCVDYRALLIKCKALLTAYRARVRIIGVFL